MRMEKALDRHQGDGDDLALSRAEFAALTTLAAAGPLRAKGLAAQLELSPSRVTRLCDELVGRGWIERKPDPDDRRAIRLELAPGGIEVLQQIERAGVQRIQRLLEPMKAGQRKALVDAVAGAVEAHEGAAPTTPRKKGSRR